MKPKRYGKHHLALWYPVRFRYIPLVYIMDAPNYSNPLGKGYWLCFWWLSFQIGLLFIHIWERKTALGRNNP